MLTSDTTEYKKLFLTTAKDHYTNMTSLLQQAVSSTNPDQYADEFYRHVHSLNGSSSIMGYTQIVDICNQINKIIQKPNNTISMSKNNELENLQNIVEKLKIQLEKIGNS